MRRGIILCFAAAALVGGMAPPAAARETPPPPGPARSVAFPAPVEAKLSNGIRIIVFQRRNVPLVAARLVVKTGAEADPPGQAGLAKLTADMLVQGAGIRNASQLTQAIEALGATIVSSVGADTTSVWAVSTTPRFLETFTLFGDVVRRPAFTSDDTAGMIAGVEEGLNAAFTDASTVAQLSIMRALYGAGPYGSPVEGTPDSITGFTREHLVRFHRRYYRPDNAVLLFGGDITPGDAVAHAERVFGNWKGATERRSLTPALQILLRRALPLPRSTVLVIDKPDAGRTAISAGWLGITRNSPDFYPALVAGAVLSGYSGRINREIRTKRGLAYSAGASFNPRRLPGPFVASTLVDHARAAEATKLLLDAVAGLSREPLTEEELKPRKAAVIGAFARSAESIGGLLGQAASLAANDLPMSELNQFISKVEAVTPEEVRQFAAQRLSGAPALVLVGNSKLFLDDLKKQFPEIRVIPSDRIDLNRANLEAGPEEDAEEEAAAE